MDNTYITFHIYVAIGLVILLPLSGVVACWVFRKMRDKKHELNHL